jgi:taurine dioxygenase
MAFTLHPLGEAGAAEIVGLDGSRPLDAATVSALKDAFVQYPILALRDQHLDPQAQAAFSRTFGELEEQINSAHVHPDDPYVLILSNEIRPDGTAVGVVDAGDFLHSDSSWSAEPVQTTILYAVKNPSRGGDTEFCNMYLVYDAIPPELKRRIEGRNAVHHISKSKNRRVAISASRPGAKEFYEKQAQELPEVVHPIVRTHPDSGRPALYISPRFTLRIEGLAPAESDEMLDALFALMKEPRFRYLHKWRDNDLVMWDNRCLTHRATGGYVLPDIRRMHRTTVSGDRPFFTPPATELRAAGRG